MNHEFSHRTLNQVDQVKIKRNIIKVVAFVLTVVVAFFTLKTGNILFMGGLLALPFALMLMNRPDLAFMFGIVADATAITIRGINYLTVGVLMQCMVIASAILSWALVGYNASSQSFREKKPLMLFTGLVLILMASRGTGLRFLGSETWGGMIYIRIFVAVAFYLAIRKVDISKKLFKYAIIGTFIGGVLGALIQRSGFVAAASQLSSIGPEAIGSKRLMWLQPFVYAAFPLVLAIRWKFRPLGLFIWIVLLGAMGLTGFRSRIVALIMVTVLFGFIGSKTRIKYSIKCFIAGALLWISAILVSPYVPAGLQRAVSFLPGTKIETFAGKDALESVEWRVEIWKYCWERFPDYFWIGRGSTFNVYDTVENLSTSDIILYTPWFAFQTHAYHSGPLTLLIDYGFPGFLVGTWLLLAIGVSAWKIAVNMVQYNSLESRYCLALCCWLLWEVISFFLVYGQMPKFGRILVAGAVVTVLARSVEKIKATLHPDEVIHQTAETV
ncbi:MAG: O-antigen ligase family protein [Pontiellaceae bacterium]